MSRTHDNWEIPCLIDIRQRDDDSLQGAGEVMVACSLQAWCSSRAVDNLGILLTASAWFCELHYVFIQQLVLLTLLKPPLYSNLRMLGLKGMG
jgi:hypothetical protein